jgi:hypothetical protein
MCPHRLWLPALDPSVPLYAPRQPYVIHASLSMSLPALTVNVFEVDLDRLLDRSRQP